MAYQLGLVVGGTSKQARMALRAQEEAQMLRHRAHVRRMMRKQKRQCTKAEREMNTTLKMLEKTSTGADMMLTIRMLKKLKEQQKRHRRLSRKYDQIHKMYDSIGKQREQVDTLRTINHTTNALEGMQGMMPRLDQVHMIQQQQARAMERMKHFTQTLDDALEEESSEEETSDEEKEHDEKEEMVATLESLPRNLQTHLLKDQSAEDWAAALIQSDDVSERELMIRFQNLMSYGGDGGRGDGNSRMIEKTPI
jgi:hypothetical protein